MVFKDRIRTGKNDRADIFAIVILEVSKKIPWQWLGIFHLEKSEFNRELSPVLQLLQVSEKASEPG